MSALVGAEFLKLRTTRAWIGYVLGLMAISGVGAAAQAGSAGEFDLGTPKFTRDVLASALFAGFVAFLVGVTSVTAEWRHGTITRTFLVMPRRERVLVAKGLAVLVLGIVLAALAIGIVLAVAVSWVSVEGESFPVDGDVLARVGRIVLAAGLWGALGVGVGAVIQSQTPALIVAILWILLVEALIQALLGLADLEVVAEFLPGQALGAFDGGVEGGLRPWVGGVVGLGWVLAIGALGYVRMERRDIT